MRNRKICNPSIKHSLHTERMKMGLDGTVAIWSSADKSENCTLTAPPVLLRAQYLDPSCNKLEEEQSQKALLRRLVKKAKKKCKKVKKNSTLTAPLVLLRAQYPHPSCNKLQLEKKVGEKLKKSWKKS